MSVKEVNSEQFEEIIATDDTILIDFWAPWCAPCKNFEPIYNRVATKFPDVHFLKVNIEEQTALAEAFSIRSIPYLVIMKEQIVIYAESGTVPESTLIELVEQARETSLDEIKKEIEKREEGSE